VNYYKFFRPIIFKLEPETAHQLAINYLKFLPRFNNLFYHPKNYPQLNQQIFNLNFTNPVGMSAGFDKNAEIVSSLFNFGFSFIEAGTTTPLPQIGNDKPRIFRLTEDSAIINRLGFNNLGAEVFLQNLGLIKRNSSQILGVNIGKNKDTADFIADYILLLKKFYQIADYITINISSPNTKNLRDIQNHQNLEIFLTAINQEKINLQKTYQKNTPIFLKIAPDLNFSELESIAELTSKNNIDAVIISNTTIDRDLNLKSSFKTQSGGLSGSPLFKKSNQILGEFYKLTKGNIKIIGVGGIANGDDAYHKIKNGASLIQIYSAFIYQGFGLVEEIKKSLCNHLKKDGFQNISQAIGVNFK